jgi:exonuclease III
MVPLSHVRRPNPNPRKCFITHLIQAIKKEQKAGADIIIGGDFNERLGETQDGLA